MILVTGGTGFIGRVLVRQLGEAGHQVRLLIRPSPDAANLPRGVTLEVAVSSLLDRRGLEGAMVGVDTVYHLAGTERLGARANLLEVDIQGTQAVVEAAAQAGVSRILTVSHLGADRASAYPVLKAKAIAEAHIRHSSIPHTILRAAVVFGPGDGLTTGLALLAHAVPFVFLLPGSGDTLIQPLWVEDLATCLVWALENERTLGQTIEVGGPEYLTFRQVVETVLAEIKLDRTPIPMRQPYLRGLTVTLETVMARLPVSVFWLDYLATHRTCALDTLPRVFGLLPARLASRLDYLRRVDWGRELRRALFHRRKRQKRPSFGG